MSHHAARHNQIIAILVVALCASGCKANVAALDDARLVQVGLASPEDTTRYREAQERLARDLFGGASFSDGKGHILESFGPDQYEEYKSYSHAHPEKFTSNLSRPIDWPLVKLSFLSPRDLYVDQSDGSTVEVEFDRCGTAESYPLISGSGHSEVMWRDQFITNRRRQAIDDAIAPEPMQKYEVFFQYVYWDSDQPRQKGQPVTLLPLPDDVCMAVHQYNYLRSPSLGRPLRISKDLINNAVGSLPRTLPVPEHN